MNGSVGGQGCAGVRCGAFFNVSTASSGRSRIARALPLPRRSPARSHRPRVPHRRDRDRSPRPLGPGQTELVLGFQGEPPNFLTGQHREGHPFLNRAASSAPRVALPALYECARRRPVCPRDDQIVLADRPFSRTSTPGSRACRRHSGPGPTELEPEMCGVMPWCGIVRHG